MRFHFIRAAVVGVAVAGCVSEPERSPRSLEDLVAARSADDLSRANAARQLTEQLLQRAERKVKAARPGDPRPTIDLLIISGGGDWGAFGAGVLKGWGRVKGEMARPEFDVVTGVSTGALIAPFAFLGDDESIERIVQLYRNPAPDDRDVARAGCSSCRTTRRSIALPGLERELRTALDRRHARAHRRAAGERAPAARQHHQHRPRRHARLGRGGRSEGGARRRRARARAPHPARERRHPGGLPGARDRHLTSTSTARSPATSSTARASTRRTAFAAQWRAKHGRAPLPRVRYWVIFNNQFRFPPQVTQAALARHHVARHHHGDADRDGERHAPPRTRTPS